MRGRWIAAGTMFADLALGRYPRFVYGRPRRRDELPPILCFHGVEAAGFERVLRRLSTNGYRTLTCAQWHERRTGQIATSDREVMLTFDDATGSMWTTATPLLRRYGMVGVTFVIPARVREAALGPTIEDVAAGDADEAAVAGRDGGPQPLATWPELCAMQASGVWDLQSHGWSHRRVFTGRGVLGWVTPARIAASQCNDLAFAVPGDRSYAWPAFGTPLYASASRLSDALAVSADEGARAACVAHVAEAGDAFFDRPKWSAELARVYAAHAAPSTMAVETAAARDRAIFDELVASKAELERRVPGARVTDLALPWGQGGSAVVEAAGRAGYVGVHWGRVGGRVCNRVGVDPLHLARIGERFADLLPGPDRVPLRRWLAHKRRGLEQG